MSPPNENARLEALRRYAILDTLPEPSFDRITQLAARLFETPIALISLIDEKRQWSKSYVGMETGDVEREVSFCAHTILADDVLIVADAATDPRFRENPQVTGSPFIRFYAGAPLLASGGLKLGSLCIIDTVPRAFSVAQAASLRDLAAMVVEALDARFAFGKMAAGIAEKQSAETQRLAALDGRWAVEARLRLLESSVEHANDAIIVTEAEPCDEPGPRIIYVNKAFTAMTGYAAEEIIGRTPRLLQGERTNPATKAAIRRALQRWEPIRTELINQRKDGSEFWVELNIVPVANEAGWYTHWVSVQRDITERKRIDSDLRESEARFRQLANAMPQIVWAARPDGSVDYYNEQWYEFTGLPPGTAGTENWAEIVHPDDIAELGIRWADSIKRGEPYEIEFRLKRASDRKYRWFLARMRPVKDAVGSIVRWFGTSTDITDHKQTEEALQAAAERLRIAMGSARQGTWDWNIESGAVVWSAEHNEMYDLPIGQYEGDFEKCMQKVHPDDRAMVVKKVTAAIASRSDYQAEMRAVHHDGSIRWILATGRAVYSPAGTPLRMTGVVQDITARRTAEEAMRQSEERFRLANIHSPFPVMLHADDGEILQVNDAWTHQTGYLPSQLTNLNDWIHLAFPDDATRKEVAEFLAGLSQYLGSVERPARRIRCANGEERIWDISHANLGRLPDGRCLRIATSIDVTERHRAEETLRQAKEEAEKANRAKSVFLSRMSHELRTPLNAILGFGQVLGMSQLGEQDGQCVDHILRGGRHLLALIDEVLDLSRVEAGELDLKPVAVTFEKLAHECVGFVSRMAQAGKVTCKVDTNIEAKLRIWADERRLRQVLLNLLANAIKYNHEDGLVTLSCQRRPNGRMCLQVKDTGCGISPDGLARLFVPFERLGQEFSGVEGTGLGLVVSKRLVEAMGGKLEAESVPGQGSVFHIDMPAAQDVVFKPAGNGLRDHPVSSDAENATSVSLLYVEDNVSNLQVVETVVKRLRPHWKFFSAKDGVSGLQQARENPPDLIILDLQLPGLGGDSVLTGLRDNAATRHIPVLMLSADATAHSRERLLASGANDYLAKPFNVYDLLSRLDAMIPVVREKTYRPKRRPSKPKRCPSR